MKTMLAIHIIALCITIIRSNRYIPIDFKLRQDKIGLQFIIKKRKNRYEQDFYSVSAKKVFVSSSPHNLRF